MIISGYKNILSYFEDVSFPIILLRTDLSVEYMNTEAENNFGKYFRTPEWQKLYFERDIERQIKRSIEKGESVVVSPPHVKDFGLLIFQPLVNEDGKTELVRLNVEIFCDIRKKLESYGSNKSLFDNIYSEFRDNTQMMEMALKILKSENNSEKTKPYYQMLEKGMHEFKQSLMCFEYLFEIMKRHDIYNEKLSNPRLDIQETFENIDGVEYTDLLGDTGSLIYNQYKLKQTLTILVDLAKNLAGNEHINVKAYESDPYFVFIFDAKKDFRLAPEKRHLEELKILSDVIKQRTEENGGHLIVHEAQNSVKIMYSIKKHLRTEYSSIFNQNTVKLRKE